MTTPFAIELQVPTLAAVYLDKSTSVIILVIVAAVLIWLWMQRRARRLGNK